MGFCLLNNVAVDRGRAARPGRAGADRRLGRAPRQRHPGHLLRRPATSCTSRCTSGRCIPGTGRLDDDRHRRGRGRDASTSRSPPARPATSTSTRSTTWSRRSSSASRPTWVLVSAGFDAHRADPLTGLGLVGRRLRRPHRPGRGARARPAGSSCSSRAATTSTRCGTRSRRPSRPWSASPQRPRAGDRGRPGPDRGRAAARRPRHLSGRDGSRRSIPISARASGGRPACRSTMRGRRLATGGSRPCWISTSCCATPSSAARPTSTSRSARRRTSASTAASSAPSSRPVSPVETERIAFAIMPKQRAEEFIGASRGRLRVLGRRASAASA